MDITLTNILLVAAGGAIGAVLRFSVGQIVDSSQFPWATFTVNIIGSFLLSLLTFAIPGISAETKLFLFTGLFGAFTTMSTFTLDTTKLFFDGQMVNACVNVFLNAGLCIFGAVMGRYAGLFILG
ncbi:MAG: fluoride efflux transporter CrcB [archaeon]|nr:fluoride efflux transporter CrcB [archaeon]